MRGEGAAATIMAAVMEEVVAVVVAPHRVSLSTQHHLRHLPTQLL
jgi:hypothetical protein